MTDQTDRELLEAAARAAGITLWWAMDDPDCNFVQTSPAIPNRSEPDKINWRVWNPLHNDGDALRLAVKLHIDVCWNQNEGPWEVNAWPADGGTGSGEGPEDHADDPFAATRRAIVRAAASLDPGAPK